MCRNKLRCIPSVWICQRSWFLVHRNLYIPSRKRVIAALNLKQPDRVPIGELGIDRKVIEGFGKGYDDVVDFAFGEGLDLVGTMASFETVETLSDDAYMDEWGCIYKPSQDLIDHPIKGPITTQTDLDNYEFPDPHVPHRLGGLEHLVDKARGKLSVPQACRQIIKTAQTCRPKPKLVKLYEKQYKVFVGLYGSLKDDFARMARLVQQ